MGGEPFDLDDDDKDERRRRRRRESDDEIDRLRIEANRYKNWKLAAMVGAAVFLGWLALMLALGVFSGGR